MQGRVAASNTAVERTRARLRVIDRVERPVAAPVAVDAVSTIPCYADASFCRCWMPAWFHYAEMAGRERRFAGV